MSPWPKRWLLIRSSAPTRSSIRSGWVRNSFTPARIARKISEPSVDELTTRMLQVGADFAELRRPVAAPCRVLVEARRCRCRDASEPRRRRRTRSASIPLPATPSPCPAASTSKLSRLRSFGSTMANRSTLLMEFPSLAPWQREQPEPSARARCSRGALLRTIRIIAPSYLRHSRSGQ